MIAISPWDGRRQEKIVSYPEWAGRGDGFAASFSKNPSVQQQSEVAHIEADSKLPHSLSKQQDPLWSNPGSKAFH
jgi:hypothetical protein